MRPCREGSPKAVKTITLVKNLLHDCASDKPPGSGDEIETLDFDFILRVLLLGRIVVGAPLPKDLGAYAESFENLVEVRYLQYLDVKRLRRKVEDFLRRIEGAAFTARI